MHPLIQGSNHWECVLLFGLRNGCFGRIEGAGARLNDRLAPSSRRGCRVTSHWTWTDPGQSLACIDGESWVSIENPQRCTSTQFSRRVAGFIKAQRACLKDSVHPNQLFFVETITQPERRFYLPLASIKVVPLFWD